MDCQSCGACCFSESDEYVALTPRDLRGLPARGSDGAAVAVKREGRWFLRMFPGRCAQLRARGRSFSCSVYGRRPGICRALVKGSAECRAERREKLALARGVLEVAGPGLRP